ncbi:MAG: hypothetical protein EWV80_18945 [Microcystis aeruginosa Ma_QC_B_20070730_S2]|uniref:Uncharacterized protein n=1 Tax=Microcystis aeruginosa Ma_QC_B_20070730_S2 TaxID=2486256 RepID=A0A552DBR2_MICAE|nr:MAG: hypothetical protein EWV80_18945 [Microcystis aeruginosa Ma_QC_B_20070730_S2]
MLKERSLRKKKEHSASLNAGKGDEGKRNMILSAERNFRTSKRFSVVDAVQMNATTAKNMPGENNSQQDESPPISSSDCNHSPIVSRSSVSLRQTLRPVEVGNIGENDILAKIGF